MPLVCIDSGIACMSILILVSFSLLFLLSYSWGCCRAVAPMIIAYVSSWKGINVAAETGGRSLGI